jgi:electron transport complex protein RnfE
MHAYQPALYKSLGVFVPLIVVNCIILGRAEAFASKNTVTRSILDGAGMGLGFCITLLLLGTVREILGSGSLLGVELFGPTYQDWVIMVLPSGGFFTFAGWLLFFNWWKKRRAGREALAAAPAGGTR